MKLFANNGAVYFDYTDVDMKAALNVKTAECRRFMRATGFWEETEIPQTVKMIYSPYDWTTEYGEAKHFESVLKGCYYKAKEFSFIDVDVSFENLLTEAARRCQRLYEIVAAKEEQRRALSLWKNLCESGCGNCQHKKRWGDDYLCDITGAILEEKNFPQCVGGVYQLFNFKAMPDENCPYNVNKKQGV